MVPLHPESEDDMRNRGEPEQLADERGNQWSASEGTLSAGARPRQAFLADGDDESDLNDFVASTPHSIAPSGKPWVDFDDEPGGAPAPHVAMYWTAGIAGGGLLLIGLFLLYSKVLMPTPEAMGAPVRRLPTPDMVTLAQPIASVSDELVVDDVRAPVSRGGDLAAATESHDVTGADSAASGRAALPQGALEATGQAAAAGAVAPRGDYARLLADARRLGLRKAAERPYLKAIEANPAGAEALSGLSMLYASQGRNVLAKARAEQALVLNQNLDEAWIALGAAEDALGKARAARAAYTRCASLPRGKYVAECRLLLR